MKYYFNVLDKYTIFTGRTSRKEYWMFILFNFLFSGIAILIDNLIGTTIQTDYGVTLPYGYIYMLYVLALIIPSIAVSVRRLHDVGKSGWFMLLVLIPVIGSIWFIVFMLSNSNQGDNKYGANPKETYF
jgi:uncharacterized membrane protein YhaH (DUF805 family)